MFASNLLRKFEIHRLLMKSTVFRTTFIFIYCLSSNMHDAFIYLTTLRYEDHKLI